MDNRDLGHLLGTQLTPMSWPVLLLSFSNPIADSGEKRYVFHVSKI